MPTKTKLALPVLNRLIEGLGLHIQQARLRRRLSAAQVAERAGITRVTLGAIESGSPSTTLGSYLNVLHVLGLHNDLALVAKDDELGRKLQDAKLPLRKRASKRRNLNQS